MAHDYTKPGKTPPGTKHTPPPRPERKTWLHFIGPAHDYTQREPEKTPTTVPFTRMEDGVLVTRDEPFNKVAAGARMQRRFAQARRDRQRAKGQRAFTRQQLAEQRERDALLSLIRVVNGETSATPAAKDNATAHLAKRMKEMQSA